MKSTAKEVPRRAQRCEVSIASLENVQKSLCGGGMTGEPARCGPQDPTAGAEGEALEGCPGSDGEISIARMQGARGLWGLGKGVCRDNGNGQRF